MPQPLEPIRYDQGYRPSQQDILPLSVKNRNIESLTFDKAQGGTLVLGGVGNVSGLMQVKDASGNVIIQGDNAGHSYFDTSGNDLVKVNSAGFHAYDTNDVEHFRINRNGIFAYGSAVNTLTLSDVADSATPYGFIGYSTANSAFWVAAGDSKNMWVMSDTGKDTYVVGDENVHVLSYSGDTFVESADGDVTLLCPNGVFSVEDSGGIKTAIVKTSRGYNALYCTESPNVWFMDFCYGTKRPLKWWKFWKKDWYIKPDPMFVEVTEGEFVVVPTGSKNLVQIWRLRKGFAKTRFESRTQEQYDLNNKFWSQGVVK